MLRKRLIPLLIFLLLSSLLPSVALADIYAFRDDKGVWHFTNIQSDKRYKLYLSSYSKPPTQYIRDYEGIIAQAANRFKLDPSLVKAVIKAESAFNHGAVSSKGAKGLMQLMPKTAEAMDVVDPFNPEENIFGGARYLGLLLGRFNNNKKLALAAYNAGPENVETYKGVPPFPETVSFIERVMKYYREYSPNAR